MHRFSTGFCTSAASELAHPMRTVYLYIQPKQRCSVHWNRKRRVAYVRVRKQRERLEMLESQGLVRFVERPRRRAVDLARARARALGVPWTRQDDAAFRAPRKSKKAKALDANVR
jgi:hypothetical protein